MPLPLSRTSTTILFGAFGSTESAEIGADAQAAFTALTQHTPLQQRAFDLLGVRLNGT